MVQATSSAWGDSLGSLLWILSVSQQNRSHSVLFSAQPPVSHLQMQTVEGGWWKSFRVSWWFFSSGVLVASWPLIDSFNLVPGKLQLDCFLKSIIIRTASFLSFPLWCRPFLLLCFFSHFRGELIDNGGSLCSSYVFWVLLFFFFWTEVWSSCIFLHLPKRNTVNVGSWLFGSEPLGTCGWEIWIWGTQPMVAVKSQE